jgi:hypothetical protein
MKGTDRTEARAGTLTRVFQWNFGWRNLLVVVHLQERLYLRKQRFSDFASPLHFNERQRIRLMRNDVAHFDEVPQALSERPPHNLCVDDVRDVLIEGTAVIQHALDSRCPPQESASEKVHMLFRSLNRESEQPLRRWWLQEVLLCGMMMQLWRPLLRTKRRRRTNFGNRRLLSFDGCRDRVLCQCGLEDTHVYTE